jgi:hypothetical protein
MASTHGSGILCPTALGIAMAEVRKPVSVAEIKLLYGLAAGRCAFASCRKKIILPEISDDKTKQIGEIAHIVAHSPDGPRGDENFPVDKLDRYENLILLCPTCHKLIDAQPSRFTIDMLRQIKADHELWVENRLDQGMSDVTFAELEIAAKAIATGEYAPINDFTVIHPNEKIKRNQLTQKTRSFITIGLSRSSEVERFLSSMSKLDSEFPERLKDGFRQKYIELKRNTEGDALFMAMFTFTTHSFQTWQKMSAGLAILVYLFQLCEIFDK